MLVGNITNLYRFLDGSGTTLTDLKGIINGTLEGASSPTWVANGYLTFSGGNGATIGDRQRVRFATRTSYEFTNNSNFSLVVIFKSSKSDANEHALFACQDLAVISGATLIRLNPSEYIDFLLRDNQATPKTKQATGAISVCDGNWHIAVLTYKSDNTMICYLDGKSIALGTNEILNGNLYTINSQATLGCRRRYNTGYRDDLTGSICFFANYSIVLSQAQIQDLQNEFNSIL